MHCCTQLLHLWNCCHGYNYLLTAGFVQHHRPAFIQSKPLSFKAESLLLDFEPVTLNLEQLGLWRASSKLMAALPSFWRVTSWWVIGWECSFFVCLLSGCVRQRKMRFTSGRLVEGTGDEGVDQSGSGSVSGVIVQSANSLQSSNSNK